MRYFYSAIQKTIELKYRQCDKGCRIYMFHQVNDEKKFWKDPSVCITAQGFKKFIDRLMQEQKTFYSIEELETAREGVCLTFDDVFSDACENAFPYLQEKRIPFCIFVSLQYIGKEGYISERQLQQLKNEPLCTIGYHSNSHRMMRDLKLNEIEEEIDQTRLEQFLGKKCDFFAFPYGSLWACTKKSVQMVTKMKYKMAFSTIAVPCTEGWWRKHRFFLPRINVNEDNYRLMVK